MITISIPYLPTRRLAPLILAAALSVLAAQGARAAAPADSAEVPTAKVAEALIREAREHLGKPYRHGAGGPKAFDCTGLTSYVYRKFGVHLSRSSIGQSRDGRPVVGDLSNLQTGDILIFGARRSLRIPGHAALFIGMDSTGNDCYFIHAARGGVMVSRLSETYYKERFMGARRVLPDFLPEPEYTTPVREVLADIIEKTVAPPPVKDTMLLASGDRRVVLLDGGRWAFVGEDGSVTLPDQSAGRLVLEPNGRWSVLPTSKVKVPDVDAVEEGSTRPLAAAAASTAPRPGRAAERDEDLEEAPPGEAVFHTVRGGDSWWTIARRYGVKMNTLFALNGTNAKTILHTGDKVRVK